MTSRLFVAGLLALSIGLLQAADAHAGFAMNLSTGGPGVTIHDGDAGDNLGGQPGAINWIGHVGGLTFALSTGVTYPAVGSPSAPFMHLDGLVVGPTGGTLTIMLTQTGFTGTPVGLAAASFLSSIGGVTNGIVSMETYASTSNAEFDITGSDTILLSDLSGIGVNGEFSGSDVSDFVSLTNPFSLTMVITIQRTGIISGFNAELEALAVESLPEPSTAYMWGGLGGCAALGMVVRRRMSAV